MAEQPRMFLSIVVKPCSSANNGHLRYEVVYRDGTPGGWCAGRAPMHMSAAAYAELWAARDRYLARARGSG